MRLFTIISKVRSIYFNNNEPIIFSDCVEYDIKKANISVALNEGIITKREYDFYYGMDKRKRSIIFVKKHKEFIVKKYDKALLKYVNMFLEVNDIPSENVFTVRRDSILFKPSKTNIQSDFDNVHFIRKNKFNGVVNLNSKISYLIGNTYEESVIKGTKNYKHIIFETLFHMFTRCQNITNHLERKMFIYKTLIDMRREILEFHSDVKKDEDLRYLSEIDNINFIYSKVGAHIYKFNILSYMNSDKFHAFPVSAVRCINNLISNNV